MRSSICLLPIEQLQRGRYQPRRQFDKIALQELADSIRNHGLIQPIVVRPITDSRFEIIAGERRWRAAQLAGLTEINCSIQHYSDEQAAAITTIENVQREDLNPIELAQGLQRLIHEFGYLHEEVAAVINTSRTKVTNLLRLLQLAEPVQQFLINGQLSEGHGKMLASLPVTRQLYLAERAVKQGWSVRKIETMVKQQFDDTSDEIINSSRKANLKRLERIISDRLGAIVAVDTDETAGGWLKIKFNNNTLAGVLQRMGIDHDEE